MVKKFTIESLEVEGFRGINAKKNFRFDRPVILLFGENGLGKSSTLGAIEWCLFGDLAYLRFLETRTRDELINVHHLKGIARVKITLQRDKTRYEFAREKELHSRKTKFTMVGPEGEFKGEEAEDKCFSLLKLTFEDFYRAVYLHQESVRGLLTEDSTERDEAMDRLLGLETLREIVDNIPVKDVKEKNQKLRNNGKTIESRVRGRAQQIESDLRKAKEKARRAGIAEKNITFEFCRETIKSMIDDLTKIARNIKLNPPKIDLPISVGGLGKGLGRAKKFCTYLALGLSGPLLS